jgi:Glycosyltransferase 61
MAIHIAKRTARRAKVKSIHVVNGAALVLCLVLFISTRRALQLIFRSSNDDLALPVLALNQSIWYLIDPFEPFDDQPSTLSLLDFNYTMLRPKSDGKLHEVMPISSHTAQLWSESPVKAMLCHVVCRFPAKTFGPDHFLQHAYPCWSLFQRYRNVGQHFYMVVNQSYKTLKTPYIQSFLTVLRQSNLKISIFYGNASLPHKSNKCSKDSISLGAVNFFHDNGFDGPVRYFMDEQSDIEELQKAVLDQDFRAGPSSHTPKTQVLILDRKRSTRDLAFASHTKLLLERTFGPASMTVRNIETFGGLTFHEQARAIHTADVILSPHGAQLANLAYIRPCTVVVELFPPGYYLQLFQSLVVAANGVSFDGYPLDRTNRYKDAQMAKDNSTLRGIIRDVRIAASPRSLLESFPELLIASEQCRTYFANEAKSRRVAAFSGRGRIAKSPSSA